MTVLEQLVGCLPLLREELASIVRAELEAVGVLGTSPAEPWRLLTLEDACERLGRSGRWVRERVKSGELPVVRLDGGALAFEIADLQAFAAARRVDAAAGMLAHRLHSMPDASAGAGLRGDRQRSRLRVG